MEGESEKNKGVSGADTDESCPSCHQYFDKEDECWGNYVPLTREEETILEQMRAVKNKVSKVKRLLKELEGHNGFKAVNGDAVEGEATEVQARWLEQKQNLEMLRRQWRELDEKRQEAARFRMKILGHED